MTYNTKLAYLALCDEMDRAVEMYQGGILLPSEFALIVAMLHPRLQAAGGGMVIRTEAGMLYQDVTSVQYAN